MSITFSAVIMVLLTLSILPSWPATAELINNTGEIPEHVDNNKKKIIAITLMKARLKSSPFSSVRKIQEK